MFTAQQSKVSLVAFSKTMVAGCILLALSACQKAKPQNTPATATPTVHSEEQIQFVVADSSSMVSDPNQFGDKVWQEALNEVLELPVTPETSAALMQELDTMKAAWGKNNRILDGFRKLYEDGSEVNLSAVVGKTSTAVAAGTAITATTLKSKTLPDLSDVYKHLKPNKIGLGLGAITTIGIGTGLLLTEDSVFGSNTELSSSELQDIQEQIALAEAKNSQFAQRISDFTNVLYKKGILELPEYSNSDDGLGY
jgi:hypothetical protein